MSPVPSDKNFSSALPLQMLHHWRATYTEDLAGRFRDLAQIMRAVNLLLVNDYAFLGIVKLPTSLESRGCELYRLIDHSRGQISLSLHNFLENLDQGDVDNMKTYVSLACQNMWLFFQLPDSSLSLVIVSEKHLTLFWPESLDWQHGRGLLLSGIALTLAALEAKAIFKSSHLMEIYQVETERTRSSIECAQDSNKIASQTTLATEFSLAHFQAWCLLPNQLVEAGVKKLVRSKFGHNCGYVCVQENEHRTLDAFSHLGHSQNSE